MINDDDLLNDDFDAGNASATSHHTQRNGIKEVEDSLDNTDQLTTSQTLFGTVPAGHETLYDFYKQQISSLVQEDIGANDDLGSKSVIVGLSLNLPSMTQDGDEDDYAEVAEGEKERYEAIMDLIRQARTW